MSQEMIVMTGNVGSGKSLTASKLSKKGYVVVNMDYITTMIQGGEYGNFDINKKNIYRTVEKSAIIQAIVDGFSVVVDRTNMKVSDRERYLEIAKYYNVNAKSFNFGPGTTRSLERRLKNNNGISKETWKRVHKHFFETYQEPNEDEGFDCILYLQGINYKFHAFDFDGTICKNVFPDIGSPIIKTCNKIHELYESNENIIIIWTCRSGDYLNQMKKWLIDKKIPFDFINENPMVDYGSPKIFAHEYYDDRNIQLDL